MRLDFQAFRSNSGTKNQHNFFMQANFRYLNIVSFYPIPWKFDFEILVKTLKWRGRRSCMGFSPRISQCVYLFMLVRALERYMYWYQKMWNFFAHLLIYVKNLSDDFRPPKHLRKSLRIDFRFSLPRKLIRVWYHLKWFLKIYNLSYSD